eukprot:6202724-Pyramimonas_sp.AAC.1
MEQQVQLQAQQIAELRDLLQRQSAELQRMAAAQPAAPAQAAAPVPPAVPRRMEGILDSKIVGKVKQFDGQ